MTSLAFILGVVPLMISEGAGAEMRRTLGTAVFGGMLGVTLFGIFLTPAFYLVIRWLGGNKPFVHHGHAGGGGDPVTLRPVRFQLAQVNIGRLAAPEDSAQLAPFFDALDPVPELLDVFIEPGRLRRRDQPALGALEQTQSHAALRRAQQLADGGLRHVHERRRTLDGAGLHHQPEDFEMAQVHR